MEILLFVLSLFTALTRPLIAEAVPIVMEQSPVNSTSTTVVQTPTTCSLTDDESRPRILSLLFENAQGRIQPVLITNGSRTKEMEQGFSRYRAGLGKELATVLREPQVIAMENEMRVLGDVFPDGINASAVRNKLQIFDPNVIIIVYTDFIFSPYNHRDPIGVYFRSQFDTLEQTSGSELYQKQLEADFIMWLAYSNL